MVTLYIHKVCILSVIKIHIFLKNSLAGDLLSIILAWFMIRLAFVYFVLMYPDIFFTIFSIFLYIIFILFCFDMLVNGIYMADHIDILVELKIFIYLNSPYSGSPISIKKDSYLFEVVDRLFFL